MNQPPEGLVLAIDPGRKKTGVALGNTFTRTAKPLETIKGGFDTQLQQVAGLCSVWKPSVVLVGIPDKSLAARSHEYCRRFGAQLQNSAQIPVVYADEAYTTQAARSEAGGKEGLDAHAACVLAQDWLAALAK